MLPLLFAVALFGTAGALFARLPRSGADKNDLAVVAALITAAVAVCVAVLNQWSSSRSQRRLGEVQRDLETLRSDLAERASASSARRSYEYEALKRLYTEVEPILFQLHEALEEAHFRVRSLARTDRDGHLGVGPDSWMNERGYYFDSTAYKLLLPLAHFRLMQRSVTFVDLNVDRTIRLRYLLLKLYARTFTDDFDLAALSPALPYAPNDPAQRSSSDTAQYERQGFVLGDLENIADAMLKEDDGRIRAVRFSEFEAILDTATPGSSLHEVAQLFAGFSPRRKPVLARMLLVQAWLGPVILTTYHRPCEVADLVRWAAEIGRSAEFARALTWTSGLAHQQGVEVVEKYVSERLARLQNAHTWT